MLGIFGTLQMGARSLTTQREGIEVAGHNLANVNNPAYARQRLKIETSPTVPSDLGPQGTGANSTAIVQLRNTLLDVHIQQETSLSGSLEAQRLALDYLQVNLGQRLDRQSTGAEGAAAAGGVASEHGLAENFSDFFAALQSLSTDPTSLAERQVALQKASDLALQFNRVDGRIDDVESRLNDNLSADITDANRVLEDLARLNHRILAAEVVESGVANDLRDQRQAQIEELAKRVNITQVNQSDGTVDISIGGVLMVSGAAVTDRLERYDAGGGQMLVRAQTAGTPLALSSGSIQGTIDVRDGALDQLRGELDTLASNLITEVNAIHSPGFSLTGSTGAAFFNGTNAGTISVNAALIASPALLQASGVAGAVGDNQVALDLARLAESDLAALGNQTFQENYAQSVSTLGQSLASTNIQIANQDIVQKMLMRQRDSQSGVSIDEEMTDMIKYQRAFEASARLVSTVDEMLQTLVNLGRG